MTKILSLAPLTCPHFLGPNLVTLLCTSWHPCHNQLVQTWVSCLLFCRLLHASCEGRETHHFPGICSTSDTFTLFEAVRQGILPLRGIACHRLKDIIWVLAKFSFGSSLPRPMDWNNGWMVKNGANTFLSANGLLWIPTSNSQVSIKNLRRVPCVWGVRWTLCRQKPWEG